MNKNLMHFSEERQEQFRNILRKALPETFKVGFSKTEETLYFWFRQFQEEEKMFIRKVLLDFVVPLPKEYHRKDCKAAGQKDEKQCSCGLVEWNEMREEMIEDINSLLLPPNERG